MTHPGLDEIPDLPWRAASENWVDLTDCFNLFHYLADENRVLSTRCPFLNIPCTVSDVLYICNAKCAGQVIPISFDN